MKRLAIALVLAASGCGRPAPIAGPGDDLGDLFGDIPADAAARETAVTEADPTGQLAVWAKVVLEPADPATVGRLRAETQARLQSLSDDLERERARRPYVSIDQRQALLRRIAYETERLRLIDGKAGP